MDYEFVERMDQEVEWLLENADLAEITNRRSIPVTMNGETREVMYDSLMQMLELVNNATNRDRSDSDNARVIAMIINGTVDEPESEDGTIPRIVRYVINMSGNDIVMHALWDVGNGKLVNKVYLCNGISKRARLRIFAILRTRINRIFDNTAGLKDYNLDYDFIGQQYQINFR